MHANDKSAARGRGAARAIRRRRGAAHTAAAGSPTDTNAVQIPERHALYEEVRARGAVGFDALMAALALAPPQAAAVSRRLEAMVRDGQLKRDKKGAYRAGSAARESRGAVGEDLRLRLDGEDAPLDLPPYLRRGLLAGDRVTTRAVGGKVVAVEIDARDREVVASYTGDGYAAPMHPIGAELLRVRGAQAEPAAGDAVVVRLKTPGARRQTPVGEIVEVLDARGRGVLEADVVIRKFGLPHRPPQAALDEAAAVRLEEARGRAARADLRELDFVTIDGESAEDYDDAIFCARDGAGWQLKVAIADVAAWVRPGGALDREARLRGNSVYLAGRVLPMLPERISNDLCSLQPGVDRLALVCHIALAADGEIAKYRFEAAVIRSKARLTYTRVGRFFDGGASPGARVGPMLRDARDAYRALLKARRRRAAVDIELPESRVLFDADGNARSLIAPARNDAHRLIEEFMVCANVCAARFLKARRAPALHRAHAGYKEGAFEMFRDFLRTRGLGLADAGPGALAVALRAAREHDPRGVVQMMLLRFFSRALYQPASAGHYGLGLSDYAHFTSPIRRYPDLVAHRAIHAELGSAAGARAPLEELRALGAHCTATEKRADDACRDLQRYFECVLLAARVGSTCRADIVGVTDFGVFARLRDPPAEGLLHVRSLGDDYYVYDEVARTLTGRAGGRVFRLGDPLDVTIAQASPAERRVDLHLPGAARRRRNAA